MKLADGLATKDDGNDNSVNLSENNNTIKIFILNELKSQDDSIRHIASLSALLLSIYFAFISNQTEYISSLLYNMYNPLNVSQYNSQNYSLLLLISTPTIFYIYALLNTLMSLKPCPKSHMIHSKSMAQEFLLKMLIRKYNIYRRSGLALVFGLGFSFLVVIIYLYVSIISHRPVP